MVPHASTPAAASTDAPALRATVASPWGPIHVAATVRGIVGVSWAAPLETLQADLARRIGGEARPRGDSVPGDPRHALLDRAVACFERWVAGEPEPFDLALDLTGLSAWDQTVLDGVRQIPWGTTDSYGGVARRIGRPGAARAVGGAVGRNPVGIVVPCHRVIAGDGTLGGYGGDAWGSRAERQGLKRSLLALEGVTPAFPTD
jgi:methylated-DNA-[protein]-cysteine S-methyltransferase